MKPTKKIKTPLIALAAVCAISLSASASTIIFEDTFGSGTGVYYVDDTDNVTFTTTPPITNASGALSWSGNGNVVMGRSFADTSLLVGQTLRVTADFTMQSGTIFRFGLFNFGSEPISADNWGIDNTGSSEGYYMFFRDNSTSTSPHRYENYNFVGNGAEIMATGTQIGGTTTQYDFATGTVYSLLYEVTRTSVGEVDTFASVSLGGSAVMSASGTTTSVVDTFDTFAFRSQAGQHTLDNVTLTLIPEPSTTLLGSLGLLALLRRRRG